MHVSVNFFHDFSITLQGTKRETQKLGLVGKFKEIDSIVKQEESNWSRIKSFQLCCKDAWEIPIFQNLITKHQKNINSMECRTITHRSLQRDRQHSPYEKVKAKYNQFGAENIHYTLVKEQQWIRGEL